MAKLGYTRRFWRKGAFFDGHDRDDVVKDRLLYLAEKLEQDKKSLHAMPTDAEKHRYSQLPPAERPYIEIVHDESACNANDSLRFQWVHNSKSAQLRSKSSGAGLMTSAFIVEMLGGVMEHDGKVAAECLEYGKGIWWNSNRMLSQLRRVIAIRNALFPWARCIWRFDHSSNHKAKAEDALNVQRMNIGPGGSQPKMRTTTLLEDTPLLKKGARQSMVFQAPHPRAGQPKGLKQVLEERYGPGSTVQFTGRDRRRKLQQKLGAELDFMQQTTLIHDLLAELCPNDVCRFYPKYHCEFSPIERFWCDHKVFCRTYCKYNIVGLRKVVPQGLDYVCGDSVQRYFGLCRRYEAAYRIHNVDSKNVDKVVRSYSSHRKATALPNLLSDLGLPLDTNLYGFCHCHDCAGTDASVCTQPCCAQRKPSVCTSARCAHHGTVHGDADVPCRLVLANSDAKLKPSPAVDSKEADDSNDSAVNKTMIQCLAAHKKCRKWRSVDLDWLSEFNAGADHLFTCEDAGKECGDRCCRCNRKTCVCKCEVCEKGVKSCKCDCPGCGESVFECTCEDEDADTDSEESVAEQAGSEDESSEEEGDESGSSEEEEAELPAAPTRMLSEGTTQNVHSMLRQARLAAAANPQKKQKTENSS